MFPTSRFSRPRRLSPQAGIVWWVVALIVVVVVIIVAAVTYVATRPSTTTVSTPKVCGGGTVNVKAHLRGASTGQTYTVTTTATRRCELGQNCTCNGVTGSFGTPTTPCDQYDGNLGPITSTDILTPAAGIVTDFDKTLSNLREGVWEVQVTVKVTGLSPAVVKTCCVIVQSGQTSSLEFWCQKVLLPGTVCPDCTTNTTPGGPPPGQTTTPVH